MECEPKEPVLFDTDDEGNEVYVGTAIDDGGMIPDGLVWYDDEKGRYTKHCTESFIDYITEFVRKHPYELARDLGLEYREATS